MYDRAPRVLIATGPLNRTSESVGPGTYSHQDGASYGTIGYAPFLSLSKRESFLTVKEQVAATPGPAQYLPQPDRHIKGGGALQSKSTRFPSPPPRAPGPGKYTIPSPLAKKPFLPSSAPPGKNKKPRLTYVRQNTAPSIPYPGQNYGYEENEYGQLKPQNIPARDRSLGPAYYNVSAEVVPRLWGVFQNQYSAHALVRVLQEAVVDTVATRKYKGTHFGSLKTKRKLFQGLQGPGPCDYQPAYREETNTPSLPNSSTTKLLRYHEIIPHQEAKKGVPGPGKYNLWSQFDQSEAGSLEVAVEPPPFGTSQQGVSLVNTMKDTFLMKRFTTSVSCSPASTKYKDPRMAMESLKKSSGLTKAPFGQTSSRFKTDRKAKDVPGPGSYDDSIVTALSYHISKDANGVKQNVFGTSSVRTVPLVAKDELERPGPAQYFQSQSKSSPTKNSSMFNSSTKRLYTPPDIVTSIPPPGSYEVSESYERSQGKIDVKLMTPNSAFLSSDARFAPPRDILLNETDSLNPGPGEYDHQDKTRIGTDPRGLICSRDKRFEQMRKDNLGPGAYQLSKSICNTLLKGTYNATLNNPLRNDDEDDDESPKRTVPIRKQTVVALVV